MKIRNEAREVTFCFTGTIDGSNYSYPVPNQADVLPCYVKGIRKKFQLLPEHGVTDEHFFND
jgi:hypothetical protein